MKPEHLALLILSCQAAMLFQRTGVIHRCSRPVCVLKQADKSFALNKVLPAIAAEYASSNGLHRPNFLNISCENVSRSDGASACLSSLLAELVAAAKAAGLQRAAGTLPPSYIGPGGGPMCGPR